MNQSPHWDIIAAIGSVASPSDTLAKLSSSCGNFHDEGGRNHRGTLVRGDGYSEQSL